MLGMLQHPHHMQFVPRFCKNYANVGEEVRSRDIRIHVFMVLCFVIIYATTAGLCNWTNVLEREISWCCDFATEQDALLVCSVSALANFLLLLFHCSLRRAVRFQGENNA